MVFQRRICVSPVIVNAYPEAAEKYDDSIHNLKGMCHRRRVRYHPSVVSITFMTMEPETLPAELILTHPRQTIGNVQLDWTPQPGNYLEFEGKTYAVLERRHRYLLKAGRYRLQKIALYVQSAKRPTEKSLIDGRWVLGDANCRFNAYSELIRCAVNPEGPCDSCRFYEPSPPKL